MTSLFLLCGGVVSLVGCWAGLGWSCLSLNCPVLCSAIHWSPDIPWQGSPDRRDNPLCIWKSWVSDSNKFSSCFTLIDIAECLIFSIIFVKIDKLLQSSICHLKQHEFYAAMRIKALLDNTLYFSSLWSDLSNWGHFFKVLNLRNPNLRSSLSQVTVVRWHFYL